jgi:hypothetical protein
MSNDSSTLNVKSYNDEGSLQNQISLKVKTFSKELAHKNINNFSNIFLSHFLFNFFLVFKYYLKINLVKIII